MRITYMKTVSEPEEANTIRDLILRNRKISDIDSFINPPHPINFTLSSFGFTDDLQKVMHLLKSIRDNGKSIVVYSDYDADGITGGAILWETLHRLHFHVMPYVPNRITEGYGFSKQGIDTVITQYHPALIISVDHGISGKEFVSYAKQKGVPVIITDHHTKPEQLPNDAFAIFHIPEFSGSGVAYMVAKEIAEYFVGDKSLHDTFASYYLALAATGTIADLVPLVGPSRSIAKHGLAAFSGITRPGLRNILDVAGVQNRALTPYDIGFIIAPRINAVGRIRDPMDALRLLCTRDIHRAHTLSELVSSTNTKRQSMVETYVEEAIQMVNNQYGATLPSILILTSHTWHEGVIGLIAAKMVERYFRPTIIMTQSESGFKASARSIPALHLAQFLAQLKPLLLSYGGHRQAAGFSITKNNHQLFVKEAMQLAEKILKPEDFEKKIVVDIRMPFSAASFALSKSLAALEPFGMGNMKPLFASDITISRFDIMGKQGNHIKLSAQDPVHKQNPIDVIAFGKAKEYTALIQNTTKHHVVYELGINTWNGKSTVQAILRHMV